MVMHGTVVDPKLVPPSSMESCMVMYGTVDGVMVELDINGTVVPVHTDKLSRRLS